MDNLNAPYGIYHTHLSHASRCAIGAWVFWYIATDYEKMPPHLLEKWRYLPYR